MESTELPPPRLPDKVVLLSGFDGSDAGRALLDDYKSALQSLGCIGYSAYDVEMPQCELSYTCEETGDGKKCDADEQCPACRINLQNQVSRQIRRCEKTCGFILCLQGGTDASCREVSKDIQRNRSADDSILQFKSAPRVIVKRVAGKSMTDLREAKYNLTNDIVAKELAIAQQGARLVGFQRAQNRIASECYIKPGKVAAIKAEQATASSRVAKLVSDSADNEARAAEIAIAAKAAAEEAELKRRGQRNRAAKAASVEEAVRAELPSRPPSQPSAERPDTGHDSVGSTRRGAVTSRHLVDHSAQDMISQFRGAPRIVVRRLPGKVQIDSIMSVLAAAGGWTSPEMGELPGSNDFSAAPAVADHVAKEAVLTEKMTKALCVILRESSCQALEEAAARAVEVLSRRDDNRLTFLQGGILPPLLQLLSTALQDAKMYAAAAVKNLVFNEMTERMVHAAGAVPPLVRLLSEGTPGARGIAATALKELSYDSQHKIKNRQAKAIPPLIDLMAKGIDKIKIDATSALHTLCERNLENQQDFIRSGLKPLRDLLAGNGVTGESARNKSRETSSAFLLMLSGNPLALKPIVELKVQALGQNGIPGELVKMLSSPGTLKTIDNAAAVLWKLSKDPECKPAVVEADAIPELVKLLKKGTEGLMENCVGCLWTLSLEEPYREQIDLAGAMDPLKVLQKVGDEKVRDVAERAIKALDNWN